MHIKRRKHGRGPIHLVSGSPTIPNLFRISTAPLKKFFEWVAFLEP